MIYDSFYRTHHLEKSCPFGEKRVFSKRFSVLVIEVVNLERRHDRMEGMTVTTVGGESFVIRPVARFDTNEVESCIYS